MGEDDCEVGSADNAIVIDVTVELVLAISSPCCEDSSEVYAVDGTIPRDVTQALAFVWNSRSIGIYCGT